MRIPLLFTCMAAATLAALPLRPAVAQDNASAPANGDVTFSLFYDNLSDDGEWYNTPEYGYVWQPDIADGADGKWRPYTDGYWAQTDSGWTWVSYENFGWATYHYGRWTRLKDIGWAWVPGYEWGPGWVSWRTDNDYVGWAPLPPKSDVVDYKSDVVADEDRPAPRPRRPRPEVIDYEDVEPIDSGYTSNVDVDYDIGPENYCFVETRSFGAPVLSEVILPPQRNVVIIGRTTNVTNIYYDRRGRDDVSVYNSGPDFAFINTRVERPIQRLQIEQRRDPGFLAQGLRAGGNPTQVRGGILQVAAPMFARRQTNFQQIKPVRVKETLAQPQVVHGWTNSGADPQTVQRLRTQFRQQAQQAPPKAAQPKEQAVQPLPPAQRVVTKSDLPVGQPKDMSPDAVAARRAQHQQQRAAQGGQPRQPGATQPAGNPVQAGRAGQTGVAQPGQALPPGQKDLSPEAKAARRAQREAARNGQATPPGQPAQAGQPNANGPRPGALTDDERKARREARTNGQAAPGQGNPAAQPPGQPAVAQPGQKDLSPEAKAARRAQRQQAKAAQASDQPAAPTQAEPGRPVVQPGQNGQNGQPKDLSEEAKAARRAQRQQERAAQGQPQGQPAAQPARPQGNPQADQEREARRAQRQQEQAAQQQAAQQQAAQQRETPQTPRQPQPQANPAREARQAQRQQEQANQPREAQPAQRQQERAGRQGEKNKPGDQNPNQ